MEILLSSNCRKTTLVSMKKYRDGERFISDEIFYSSQEVEERRRSGRRAGHSQTLQEVHSQRNSTEEKLAAAKTRRLWNSLKVEDLRTKLDDFKNLVKSDEFFRRLCEQNLVTKLQLL